MPVKLTTEQFIIRSRKVHGKKYDYDEVSYVNTKQKVKIKCLKHGIFTKSPESHIGGQGCPACSDRVGLTKKNFVQRATKIHRNKYDYSLVEYINSSTKVAIICEVHGHFMMAPNAHLSMKAGCRFCGYVESKRKQRTSFEKFISDASEIHGDTYYYDRSSYTSITKKMRIKCEVHGWFEQSPHSHISMRTGCPTCGYKRVAEIQSKTWLEVKELFQKAHGEVYDYSEFVFENVTTPSKIICSKHGVFVQRPVSHYRGAGCPKCSVEAVHDEQKIDFDKFIVRAKDFHGEKYVYDKASFVDIFTPMEIKCPSHGGFLQAPRDHYRGSGCPQCLSSKGETVIRNILTRVGVKFEEQKKFKGMAHKGSLRCDFYLPNLNCVIEFNGKQHYEPIELFGGVEGLKRTQIRDAVKYEFLERKGIDLLIFSNPIDEIESKLVSYLENYG